MKKLSSDQVEQLAKFVDALDQLDQTIEDDWGEYLAAHSVLCKVVAQYNQTLREVNNWRDDIVAEMTEFRDTQPDEWQVGDEGLSYLNWIDEWETCDLEELPEPELPDQPNCYHTEELEMLPKEPAA